ncbi:MAG: nucleoside triphosphate pyrophosphohydrolase [Gammaproteobacteria bacterium]|nr:nucleoside triphosphate pyrophosphohydrolase [Gammaproteobacteria bacterium]
MKNTSNLKQQYDINQLIEIMSQLRDPIKGCPWDLKQDYASIVKHTIEEAYEVADVIERKDFDALPNELGDLLFQVIFYAQLGKEQQRFDFNDVVNEICTKLIRRHPHVFTDQQFDTEQQINANWENEKARERAEKQFEKKQTQAASSLLDDIPHTMPALSRAAKIQKRVAHHGFDWPSWHGSMDKIKEELEEVEQELVADIIVPEKVNEELGDLLFAVVNLVRTQGVDPEQALRSANKKFERRFRGVEARLAKQGMTTQDATLVQMDAIWDQVKVSEKDQDK